jgi:hypothetical protein
MRELNKRLHQSNKKVCVIETAFSIIKIFGRRKISWREMVLVYKCGVRRFAVQKGQQVW